MLARESEDLLMTLSDVTARPVNELNIDEIQEITENLTDIINDMTDEHHVKEIKQELQSIYDQIYASASMSTEPHSSTSKVSQENHSRVDYCIPISRKLRSS